MVLLFSSTVLLLLSSAPPDSEQFDRFKEPFGAIFREALEERNTFRMLKELCETAPRRISGSPAAAAAVEWARQTMQKIGLENVRLEPCRVPHWNRGKIAELRIVESIEGPSGSLPILALGGSIATPDAGITPSLFSSVTIISMVSPTP